MELFVIRHGEVDLNAKHLLNGRNDSSLTEKGINQARSASETIKELPIDVILCSPLKRTIQTCEIINKNNIQVIYDDRVLERNTNSVMYRPDSSINLIEFYSPNNDIIYHDCEGFKSILKRASDFIEDIKQKYKDKSVLVVSHLDFCKAMYCCLKNEYDINKIISFNQDNCKICKYIL